MSTNYHREPIYLPLLDLLVFQFEKNYRVCHNFITEKRESSGIFRRGFTGKSQQNTGSRKVVRSHCNVTAFVATLKKRCLDVRRE